MKLNTKLLLGILVIALIFRAYSLSFNTLIGNDPFIHASIIRQYLETGNLETYELTGGPGEINQPKGLYWVTILPALMGIQYMTAFKWVPIMFGAISVALLYYLLKNLFNNKVALIGSLMLSVSIAHIYRTMANSYRGDGFFLTFLLGLMLVYTLFLKAKDRKQLLLAGLSVLLITGMIAVWNGHLLGIAILVAWLLLTQLIAYYKGEKELIKKLFIYSLIVLPAYLLVNWVLIATNFITQFFLNAQGSTLIHAMLTLLPVITSAVFSFTVKLRKQLRLTIIITLIGGSLVFLGLNYSIIASILSNSVFFTSTLFTAGVAELLPPEAGLMWAVYNLSYYLMWPGIVIFSLMLLKLKHNQLTILAYTVPVLFLMHAYSRYVFLGSIITVTMSALLIDYAYSQLKRIKQLKKFAIALPISLLIPYSILNIYSFQSFGPRVTEPWIQELEWVKANLEPGKVVSWWDHGSWIQYYTGFSTVVDSVYGQVESSIQRIARFLLTDNNDAFSDWDPDYLIIGYDIIFYLNAVMELAGEYGLEIVLPTAYSTTVIEGEPAIVYYIGNGQFEVYEQGTIFRNMNNQARLVPITILTDFNQTEIVQTNTTGFDVLNGCFLISPSVTGYFNEKACSSNMFNLLFLSGIENYNPIHSNGFVSVYEIV